MITWFQTLPGILLPFLGTVLGSSMVFFIKKEMPEGLQKGLLGFASGVMIAASVWSLLIPAMEMSDSLGALQWIPAVLGFLLGVGFLLLLDTLIPHQHFHEDTPEGRPSHMGKSMMLVFAVTLHNLPEGMAVGAVLAGMMDGSAAITMAAATALAIGIAIQNFPEGAIISMPLTGYGLSRPRAFGYGVLSAVVEPLGAILTLCFAGLLRPVLPYLLSFAAGSMIYVVVEELIPESQMGSHSNIGTIGAALGFALMMLLDVALG